MAKKLYYKIGEACKLLDIQPYVLRYWETEFGALSPTKSKSGQRVYGERDLAVIRRIKELLYDEGYTIAGAKKKLAGEDLASLPTVGEEAPAKKPKAGAGRKEPAEVAEPEEEKPAAKPAARAAKGRKTGAKPAKAVNKRSGPSDREARLEKALRHAVEELREIRALLDR